MDALLLDSEGLSKTVAQDRDVLAMLDEARLHFRARRLVSAVTLVEARDPSVHQARFDWAVSGMKVVPVSEQIARQASKLLAATMLHGHKYAIDAIVCATALAEQGQITILTSDVEDIETLTEGHRRIKTVKV